MSGTPGTVSLSSVWPSAIALAGSATRARRTARSRRGTARGRSSAGAKRLTAASCSLVRARPSSCCASPRAAPSRGTRSSRSALERPRADERLVDRGTPRSASGAPSRVERRVPAQRTARAHSSAIHGQRADAARARRRCASCRASASRAGGREAPRALEVAARGSRRPRATKRPGSPPTSFSASSRM